VLSTVAGLDNDRRSFLSTDSISQSHTIAQDNMSVHSESTTGHVSTSSAMTYDTPSIHGQEQLLHPINSSLSLSEPLMSNDEVALNDAYAVLGSSVAKEQMQQTNMYDGPSRASTITGRANNGSSYAASQTMAEMVDEINYQLEQQNLKKLDRMASRRGYARDSDISSDEDDDEDAPPPSNYSNSQSSPLPSPYEPPYPTVGFHNGYAPPDDPMPTGSAHGSISHTMQHNGSYNDRTPDGSPLSPSYDIFPLDIPPQMQQRTHDPNETQNYTLEMREIQGSQGHVNRPYIPGSESVVTRVLEPVESITLSLQDTSNVFYKPDELDSPVNNSEGPFVVQKPDTKVPDAAVPDTRAATDVPEPTSPSIASSSSSKGTIRHSVSQPSTPVGTIGKKVSKSFFSSLKSGKKYIKVDGNTNKVVTSTVPQAPRRKESKTQHSFVTHTSHYTPFGSLVGKKSDAPKSDALRNSNHSSRIHLPSEPPKSTFIETRNSISDDDKISDSEGAPNHMSAAVADGRDSFGDHRSSVASGSVHDHRSSIASNSSQEHRSSVVSNNSSTMLDHRPSIASNGSQEHRSNVVYNNTMLDHRQSMASNGSQEHRSNGVSNNNMLEHKPSIASKPLPIPHPDQTIRSSSSVRSSSSLGNEGPYSTSPASISNSSRAANSPRQMPLIHEPDRSAPPVPRVGPTIERLRRYAQTNMEFIKYMSYSDLISFASDLFGNMRKLELEREYENAYIHGMQAMT
jgi:hypothetical protein